ncbi:mRNA 3' end processing factor [Dimargaris cristalligena]|nr:mRNA 3' end processing factor [Dimargaris cristalligena]
MSPTQTDLEAFRQDYVNSLEDLTLNSRPIIKNLTVIAGENQQAASVVAEVVCSRLHSAPPRYKVPVLFLIDSICKNVGHAYIPEFAKRIVPAFTSAYNKISPDDRHNFRRVLAIWKENKPRPLFPVSVIAALDKHIHQTAGQRHPQPQSQPPHQQPPYAQYTTHSAKPGYYPVSPPGMAPSPATSVPSTDPMAILNALRSLTPQIPLPTTTAAPLLPTFPVGNPVPAVPTDASALLQQLLGPNAALLSTLASIGSSIGSIPALQPVNMAPSLSNQSVYPSANLSGGGGPGLQPTSMPTVAPFPGANLPLRGATNGTRPSVNKVSPIQLNNEDLQKKRPGLVATLYDAIPLKCKQCGARYPETSIGKKQLDKHLDWHFRSNSRFKDKVRQAQPRGWFVSEKDWIDSRQTDNEDLTPAKIFEQATAGHDGGDRSGEDAGASNGSSKPEADGEAGDHEHSDDALLRAMVITVPSEPHSSICPVCNEKLTGVWSEDEEDWVYRNAVLVEGDSIYHATCRTDMLRRAQASGGDSGDEGLGESIDVKKEETEPLSDNEILRGSSMASSESLPALPSSPLQSPYHSSSPVERAAGGIKRKADEVDDQEAEPRNGPSPLPVVKDLDPRAAIKIGRSSISPVAKRQATESP